jgi:hypothetical protein
MSKNSSRILAVDAALLAAIVMSFAGSAAALNDDTLREPPRGAGTETGEGRLGDAERVHDGVQMAGLLGVGYGVGVGGRVGYAFRPGVYAGGAFTFYSANATFVGGEVGYKLFLGPRWELEPYVFVGPAFVRAGDGGFGRGVAATVWGIQPGFIGAYHFGPAFVLAEMRAYVTPNPGALALFGGIGVAL